MKDFDSFLNSSDATPRAILAVMGKHPAWNDHIDDFGISTRDLATLKRIVYLSDIAENIDSGAWAPDGEGRIFENFDNVFLWSKKDNHIMGAIWASKDGKGRDKYPMIAAIQCSGVRRAKIVADLPSLLKDIESNCKKLSKSEDVVKYLEGVQNSLNKWVEPDDIEITRLPQMAFSKAEIEKILQTVVGNSRPCLHLRFLDTGDNPFLYEDAARGLFSGLPVLNIYRRDKGIIDIIAGEPDARSLFCLKASLKAVPPLSELSFDSRMLENPDFQKAMKLVSEGKPVSLRAKSRICAPNMPLRKYLRISAFAGCALMLFAAALYGIFSLVSNPMEDAEATESEDYSVEIISNESVENSPIEDVWGSLLIKTRGWVAATKNALKDKKVVEGLRSNQELNDKFLMPFLYGAKKFNNYDLSEVVDFGEVDLSYAMENPGNIIKRPPTQRKLRSMLSLLLQIKGVQESWNAEKLFAEGLECLKHNGFASLNMRPPDNEEWIFKAAETAVLLKQIDSILSKTNEADEMAQELASDAGFEKISSDLYKSRAQAKTFDEAENLIAKDCAVLSKALNFLKNEFPERCDAALFEKSEDFKDISAASVDERIKAILKYEKIPALNNPAREANFAGEKAKIGAVFKTLSNIAAPDETSAYEKEFSAIQQRHEKLQSIATIAKNFGKIEAEAQVVKKELQQFAARLERFAAERGDIRKWAGLAKSAEISGDEIVMELWKEFRDARIKSLDCDSINKNLSLKIDTIKSFGEARDRYARLAKSLELNLDVGAQSILKNETTAALNRAKKKIISSYLNSETGIDLQEVVSKLKKTSEAYAMAAAALEKILDSLERPNFFANAPIGKKISGPANEILSEPSKTAERIKSALEDAEALNRINDANALLEFAKDEGNEKALRLEYYKKACLVPYSEGAEEKAVLAYESLKKTASPEMLEYIGDASFRLWKSALGFYGKNGSRNLKTAGIFTLGGRLGLSGIISKTPELRYEAIIAARLRGLENIKSADDLRAAIRETAEALSADRDLSGNPEIAKGVESMKAFDVDKALAPGENSLASSGPASVGWKAVPGGEAGVLKFEKDGIVLEFVLCSEAGKCSFYMQSNETGVGEFFGALLPSPGRQKILARLPDWKYEDFDDVNGPVPWILSKSEDSYRIRKNWITDANDAGNSMKEAPSKNSPMNWISLYCAKEFSKMVGCRLPTEEEYSIAAEIFDNSGCANLRDKKWSELFEKYKAQNSSALSPRWQDDGIFDGGEKFPSGESANPVKEESDNFAWFAAKSKHGEIENLYGNVWEYTSDNSIFGHSALSPWKFERGNCFKKLSGENKYYCDVGMRLCFSSPAETPSKIFLNLLTQLPKYK